MDAFRRGSWIGRARETLGRFDGVLRGIPNAQVLLAPLTTNEAVLSSKIEGTQATLGEVLEFDAAEDSATGKKRDDIQEVLNYRKAMHHAVTMLDELPLSEHLIRETHRVLLSGVRGERSAPGEYRRIPNWIGPPGCTAATARFLPPDAREIPKLMSA